MATFCGSRYNNNELVNDKGIVMNQPKMTDVAKKAGVSPTTVSRVINRRGYLSTKTINKVEAAMRELNYRPNMVARQLQSQRTMTIGILVPTVATPFFGELTYKLERDFFNAGFKVLIGNAENDVEKERLYLQQLLARQVDGLVIATHNHQQQIPEYQNANLPIVSIDRYLRASIPNVSSDNYAGGRLATEELIARGAKHIIHTDSVERFNKRDYLRQQAYQDVMNEHGLTPVTYKIDFGSQPELMRQFFNRILDEHPEADGFFASNDMDAIQLLQTARQREIRVPEDLQVIGYDGVPTTTRIVPELSTIVQPLDEMAKVAVDILQREINGERVTGSHNLPVRLRASASLKQ